ncbi:hypothetical protein HanPI659440_Chr00c11g0723621 [Helianthus annuus]|nr:hypothetical protein HanPI659440_Chr00c11g0723621 [Helianthus annuus]
MRGRETIRSQTKHRPLHTCTHVPVVNRNYPSDKLEIKGNISKIPGFPCLSSSSLLEYTGRIWVFMFVLFSFLNSQ